MGALGNIVGSAYVSDSQSFTLLSSSVSSGLYITGSGSITATTNSSINGYNGVNITANSNLSVNSITSANGSVLLESNTGSITVVPGNSINIKGTAFLFANTDINVNSITSTNGQINLATTNGSITQSSGSTLNGYNGVDENANNGLTASTVLSLNNSIYLTSKTGALNVLANSLIESGRSTVTLNAASITNGSINIGANVTITGLVTTAPTNNNEVILAIGSIPTTGTNTTIPANVVVNKFASGQAYFGTNNITAASPNNTINVNGTNVLFSGASSTTPIKLGGGDIINASLQIILTSLDLTQSAVTSNIVSLQPGILGGTLIVNGSGVATGGDIIVNPFFVNTSNLSALNIPANVTLQLNNYTLVNSLEVNLSSTSTTLAATVNGTEEFTTTGGSSQAIMLVTGSNINPNLTIGSTGSLTSDGSLSINITNNNTGTGTFNPNGLVNNGSILSKNDLDINIFNANTVNTSNLNNNAIITSSNGNVNLTINNAGAITQNTGTTASINGNSVNFISSSGNIGSGSIGSSYVNVNTTNLSVNSQANVYINDLTTSTLNLNASNLGSLTFDLISANNININGAIDFNSGSGSFVGTLNLTANTNGNITATALNSNYLITSKTTSFTTNGGNIGSSSIPINLNAENISFNTGGKTGSAYAFDNFNTNNIDINKVSVGTAASDTFALYSTQSSGNSIINTSGSPITAPNIVLASQNNPIGSSITPFTVNSNNVTISAPNSNVYVNDNASGTINFVNTSLAGLNLTNSATTGTGGLYQFTDTNTGTSNLVTTTNSFLTANSITLKSDTTTTANLGSSTQAFNVNTSNLSLLVPGSAYINNTSANINLNAITLSATGILSLTSLGQVNVNSALALGSSTGSGTITLIATGNITQTLATDSITAGNINLTANNGSILTSANVLANTIFFTTTQAGAITINSNVGLSTSNVSFDAQGTGYITTGANGTIIGNSLSLVANDGEVGFNGNGLITSANNIVFSAGLSVGINNTSASLNLGASGTNANLYIYQSGNLTASGLITAPVLGLYSFNGTTGIGTASNIIQVSAHNIAFESLATGSSVYVNDTYAGITILQQSQASLNAGTSGTGGVFKLTTAGPMSIYAQIDQGGIITAGSISAQIVAIQTLSGYGLYNDANINSNDFIFLTASQTGYIAQANTNAIMSAPNIALVSGGGLIGGAANSYLLLNSAKVAASTQGNGSYVNIYDEAATSGIVGGQSGSYFTFNTNGNLNVYGSIATGANATGGNMTLSGNGIIDLGVTAGIHLTTNNGFINIQDNNSSAGSIKLASSDYVYTNTNATTAGYVVFNIGTYNATNTTNPNPGDITVTTSGGANVYFGNNGISATSNGNVLNAKGQSIIFNTGSLPSSAITLNGNVSITADPPVLATLVSTNTVNSPVANYLINNNISFGSNSLFTNPIYIGNTLDNQQATTQLMYSPSSKIDSSNTGNDNINSISQNNSIEAIAYNCNVLVNDTNNVNYGRNFNVGSNLIIAKSDLNYKVNKLTNLSIKGGAVVLLINNGLSTSIYNLHDNHGKSVLVKINNQTINVKPGSYLGLSLQNHNFASLNPLPSVGYRNLSSRSISNITIHTGDYSILSLITAVKPIKNLFYTSNHELKHIASQILKTASVINSTTVSKGVYTQVTKPQFTAFKKPSSNFASY